MAAFTVDSESVETSMPQFVCLLFGQNRKGLAVQPIDAQTDDAANVVARELMSNYTEARGYEIWREGVKVGNFFRPAALPST